MQDKAIIPTRLEEHHRLRVEKQSQDYFTSSRKTEMLFESDVNG